MTVVNDLTLEDKELVIAHCGNCWVEFALTVPEPHVELFEKGLAAIFRAYPETVIATQIMELVVDENVDANMRSMALRHMIYDNIKDLINRMGVSLNNDYLELDHLPLLLEVADFFFVVTEIQDSFQTVLPQLLATEEHPKYRFINALAKVIFDEEEPDLSELECIIDDVSEVTLKSIIDSLTQEDGEDIPPENIIQRVIAARALLDGSLGFTHVRNGGGLGSPVENYLNFFNRELTDLLEQNTVESFELYGKHVISLYLISELNDDKIKEGLLSYFDGRIDDVTALIRIESLIKGLNLPTGA